MRTNCMTCGSPIDITRHPKAGQKWVHYEYAHVPGGKREGIYPNWVIKNPDGSKHEHFVRNVHMDMDPHWDYQ